jgi:hypothetical protein
MITRSATRWTVRMSCVTTTLVTFLCRAVRKISSLITSLIIGSRPVVGSSKNITCGSIAIARASPTRFFIPPESSEGFFLQTLAGNPTSCKSLNHNVVDLWVFQIGVLPKPKGDVFKDIETVEQCGSLKEIAVFESSLRDLAFFECFDRFPAPQRHLPMSA